jgi:hypothetical protein
MDIVNTPITQCEIGILKHTIGLDKLGREAVKEPYRNYYNSNPACDGYEVLKNLCERGFMRQYDENYFMVTKDGEKFIEEILGIVFMYEPKVEEWRTLSQKRREAFTSAQDKIYCPHCGNTYHSDNPYEEIVANFDFEDACVRYEENATLDYDRTCDNCGKSYHLEVDAIVELYYTTTCETEE